MWEMLLYIGIAGTPLPADLAEVPMIPLSGMYKEMLKEHGCETQFKTKDDCEKSVKICKSGVFEELRIMNNVSDDKVIYKVCVKN